MHTQTPVPPPQKGFTIVELLIVIVVIGILAALVLNSFAGAQDKAKYAKAQNDFKVLTKAANAAKATSGQPLYRTLSGLPGDCVECSCRIAQANGENLNTLSKTSQCWTEYIGFINALSSAAAGTNLDGLKGGSPWGAPYFIDMNEGVGTDCRMDDFTSSGKDGAAVFDPSPFSQTDPFDMNYRLPLSGPPCA